MILVTVGAQMPFDRLVDAVDDWAARSGRDDVFAQIGPTDHEPAHLRWVRFLEPEEFRSRVRDADVVVAHAGMGTILTALELGTPLLVMPRRGDLRETRNDHQVATAERFGAMGHVTVARGAVELAEKLERLTEVEAAAAIPPHASESLIAALREFVHGDWPRGCAPAPGRRDASCDAGAT